MHPPFREFGDYRSCLHITNGQRRQSQDIFSPQPDIFAKATHSLIFLACQVKLPAMQKLTETEISLAKHLQGDLPVVARPFSALARASGLTEAQALDVLRTLRQAGAIRKVAAILRHQRAGYRQNALIVWAVGQGDLDRVGGCFASLPFVSHCYARQPAFLGRYTLFTMVHARHEAVGRILSEMAAAAQMQDYLVMESLEEYKKTSPEYF